MAEENLGKAVLRIEVDDKPARNALKLLRQDIENVSVSKGTQSSISKQAKSERDLEVLKEKRFRLARRIEALEEKGVNVSRLRTQLGRLTTAYAERDFTLARNTARELARQATLAERTEKRRARAARSAKAEADESIRSARGLNRVNIDGSLRDVGSPRFVTRGARQGGQAESINALTAAQRRRYSLDQQIRSLEASGIRTDQLRARLGEVTTAQANRQFGTFNRLADTLDFTLRKERDKLKVLQDQNREYKRIGKLNTAPVRGGAAFPGSPAFLDAIFPKATRKQFEEAAKEIRQAASAPAREVILERRAQQRSLQTAGGGGLTRFLRDVSAKEEEAKRSSAQESKRLTDFESRLTKTRAASAAATQRSVEAEKKQARATTQGRISSGLIGGAFPLLFGQGGGAAAGGLLGGLAGGGPFGFGASLVGTLLGSQVDLLNQRFTELGTALQDPIASLDVFIQKATLASKAQEGLATALVETGKPAEAARLITQEASRTIDPVAVQGAIQAQDEFNRTLSNTQDALGSIVSGPATGFLNFLNSILKVLGGSPGQKILNPLQQSIVSADNAANSLGRNIGATVAGLGLFLGGVSTTFVTGGGGAPVGVPLAAAGLSLAGIGAAGAGAAAGDLRVANSSEVLEIELEVAAAKERQISLEQQIGQAAAQNKKGLTDQLQVQAQFNTLKVEELQGLSAIQQELQRNKGQGGYGGLTFGDDKEDRKKALDQEKDLRKSIELRRQALLNAASAAQTASVTNLKNTRQLGAKTGVDRDIAASQLEVANATKSAYEAQQQLNKARSSSTIDIKAIETAEKNVNTAINERTRAELNNIDLVRRAREDLKNDTLRSQSAVVGIQQRTGDVISLRNAAAGPERDRLRIQQAGDAAIADARRRAQQIQNEIQTAQSRGDTFAAAGLTNNLNEAIAATGLASQEASLALQELDEQLASTRFKNLQSAVQQSAQEAESAADRFNSAGDTLRGAAEAAFKYLPGPQRAGLLAAAREDISRAGFVNTRGLKDSEVLAVGSLARNLTSAQSGYVQASETLGSKIDGLASKRWNVDVNVQGGNATAFGDVLNGVFSS